MALAELIAERAALALAAPAETQTQTETQTEALTVAEQHAALINQHVDTLRQQGAIVWQTKNGTVKSAHSATGQALAPRAARMADAQTKTLQALHNGQFRPLLRDIRAALTAPALAGLVAHVNGALATVVDGVTMAPVGDALAAPNKRAVLAVAEWARAPYGHKAVKGQAAPTIVEVKQSKALAALLLPLVTYADEVAQQDAAQQAGL